MSDARQAIRAAEFAGAPDYAPYQLEAAEQLLQDAEGKLQERRYREARHLAENARAAALQARESARAISSR